MSQEEQPRQKKAIIEKVRKGKLVGQFRFNLFATNGKQVGSSYPETYHNLQDCKDTLTNNFGDFDIVDNSNLVDTSVFLVDE